MVLIKGINVLRTRNEKHNRRENRANALRCQNFQTCVFLPLSLWLPLLVLVTLRLVVVLQLQGDGVRHELKVGEALVAGGGGGARLNDRFMT